MEMKVQVPFRQLLTIVKTLTPAQKAKLRAELEEKQVGLKQPDDFLEILLNGPVATQKQLDIISSNRKSINQWRTK
jgi:hypothetical protein